MNRRDFLKLLGISTAGMAAPKLIFDMGKNSHIYTPIFDDDVARGLFILADRIKAQIEEIRSISLFDGYAHRGRLYVNYDNSTHFLYSTIPQISGLNLKPKPFPNSLDRADPLEAPKLSDNVED